MEGTGEWETPIKSGRVGRPVYRIVRYSDTPYTSIYQMSFTGLKVEIKDHTSGFINYLLQDVTVILSK